MSKEGKHSKYNLILPSLEMVILNLILLFPCDDSEDEGDINDYNNSNELSANKGMKIFIDFTTY